MSEHQAFSINEQKTVSETVEGEAIIINLETGSYYSLNPIASVIWNLIAERYSVHDIETALTNKYGLSVRDDLSTFIRTLREEKLILPSEAISKGVVPTFVPEVYGAPELLKYEDMQAMLLADPVHDVDQSGWPILKKQHGSVTPPLLSVIIPVFNTEAYIADAIQSILNTNYPELEIIVVDDGSTDSTPEVLRSFGDAITVIRQSNQGQSVARNVGLRASTGTLIAFLDADDVWTENHLSVLRNLLDEHPDCVLARGNIQYVRLVNGEIVKQTEGLFMQSLVGSCLYRREVFATVGEFDEEMRSGEDGDWNLRFEESGLLECRTDEVVLLYRRHDRNMTNTRKVLVRGQIDAARKRVERVRSRAKTP
ncbi:PqqD family peptide modification chaperone [Candidatus Kaiserbacteria bacterium]|nr:PqqD family peptide modification chaperone [Candidatus Kaiserbacteria bacterium]